jgi:hypothetical protein
MSWIPTNKALPAIGERVLVASTWLVSVLIARRMASDGVALEGPAYTWITEGDGAHTHILDPQDVTHWMSLPSKP